MNCSHGWITNDGVSWYSCMFENDDNLRHVFSSQMRLGNNNRQLKLFLSYDCGQMNPIVLNGHGFAYRWAPVFRGGLKYASAFWDSSKNVINESRYYGKNYAIALHTVKSFKYAWLDAMSECRENAPAVLATGTDIDHCWERHNGMNINNYKLNSTPYRRLQDNEIGVYCMTRRRLQDPEPSKNTNNLSVLNEDSVNLYEVAKGPGNITVLNKLIHVISNYEGKHSLDQKSANMEFGIEYSFVSQDDASLIVYEDGTKATYMNAKAFQIAKKRSLYPINQQRLEKLGMDFVKRNLSEYIVLGPNEKLVPQYFVEEIDHSYSVRDNKSTERVVGTQIVFTREIDGIPVVGPGSRVAIMFANDETPVGFNFDWPIYQRENKTQRIASKEIVFRRMSTLTGMDSQVKNVNLERVSCGYYDPGVQIRSERHSLQAACRSSYQGYIDASEQGESSYGLIETIPIAEFYDIEYDPNWEENNRLFDSGEISKNTSISPLWLNFTDC